MFKKIDALISTSFFSALYYIFVIFNDDTLRYLINLFIIVLASDNWRPIPREGPCESNVCSSNLQLPTDSSSAGVAVADTSTSSSSSSSSSSSHGRHHNRFFSNDGECAFATEFTATCRRCKYATETDQYCRCVHQAATTSVQPPASASRGMCIVIAKDLPVSGTLDIDGTDFSDTFVNAGHLQGPGSDVSLGDGNDVAIMMSGSGAQDDIVLDMGANGNKKVWIQAFANWGDITLDTTGRGYVSLAPSSFMDALTFNADAGGILSAFGTTRGITTAGVTEQYFGNQKKNNFFYAEWTLIIFTTNLLQVLVLRISVRFRPVELLNCLLRRQVRTRRAASLLTRARAWWCVLVLTRTAVTNT